MKEREREWRWCNKKKERKKRRCNKEKAIEKDVIKRKKMKERECMSGKLQEKNSQRFYIREEIKKERGKNSKRTCSRSQDTSNKTILHR